MLRLVLCTFATLLLCLPASEASADKVRTLSAKLERSSSAKVRISAALSLAKMDDNRAIQALARALREDSSADIRRISAASLGQRLGKLNGKVRNATLAVLREAAARDRDKNVRASARVALSKSDHSETASGGKTRGVLVEVSAPTVSKRLPARTASLMQNTVKQVLRDKAPSRVRSAPGTGMPSDKQLKQKGLAGYSILPAISALKMIRKGRLVTVRCEVQIRLSPWADAGQKLQIEQSALVSGSGTVTSGSSKRAVADSSEQCLTAVIAQVTSNQVVPYLTAKARER